MFAFGLQRRRRPRRGHLAPGAHLGAGSSSESGSEYFEWESSFCPTADVDDINGAWTWTSLFAPMAREGQRAGEKRDDDDNGWGRDAST